MLPESHYTRHTYANNITQTYEKLINRFFQHFIVAQTDVLRHNYSQEPSLIAGAATGTYRRLHPIGFRGLWPQ
jgi:hypothetical protein